MGPVKRKSIFEHAQNAQIQIIQHKVSPRPLLSIYAIDSVSGQ